MGGDALVSDSFKDNGDGEVWKAETAVGIDRTVSRGPKIARAEVKRDMVVMVVVVVVVVVVLDSFNKSNVMLLAARFFFRDRRHYCTYQD